MQVNLNNRSFLREHPDLPPWIDSSFVKNHSFIFPGDELVMYNGINLPGDAGASSMSEIQFKSVKLSIIAKKPNIFSYIFSNQFAATRSFDLDSFTINFTNNNAPIIPWGSSTTSDGYAPNINYQTDRNWKLPSGNFKRQVNMFTSHAAGTNNWTYWFYFPVLYRWEYWKPLIGADNDFVTSSGTSTGTTTPGKTLNNKTQNWLNYAQNPKWEVVSHCELNLIVNGNPVTLVSDLDLTRMATSIQPYSSNPDYINKSITTSKVGGVASQNPSFVYTDQNTSVFANFTKVSDWEYREQKNITGFIWIEVFQGGGEPQRLRTSSSFEATPESCFINLQQPLLNDDGNPLLNDLGDPILKDPCGVLMYYNGQNITMEAQIDYNKLKASFPNATGFNIYARLYNSTPFVQSGSNSQFVAYNTNNSYTITGIPTGYTLGSTVLPTGWSIVSTGSISGGSQTFVLKSSGSSGTFIANYTNGTLTSSKALDISVNATTMGESLQTALQKGTSPLNTLGDNVVIGTISTLSQVQLDYTLINTEQNDSICPTPVSGCPFTLPVFADPYNPTNPLNNDQSDFYYQGNPLVANITMTLQKGNGCGGPWINVLTLTNGYLKQASLALTIASWSGNYYMLGTFTIGAKQFAISFYGTYAGYLAYLAGLINADGTYSATVQAGGITIFGKNGALSNGTAVKQTLTRTSSAFSAQQIASDERILNATGTTVNLTYNPVKFSNIEINSGNCFNGTTYTAGSDPVQTFSGTIWFETRAAIDANFDSGVCLLYLKKNGITIAIQTLNSAKFNGNGTFTEFGFIFANVSVSPGDQITLAAYANLTMLTSGNGTSLIGNIGGNFNSTSSATVTTNLGLLNGGVTGVGAFAKYFSYGNAPDFSGNLFTDENNNKYTGALLSWLPILQGYGAGEYQMQVVYTMVDGSTQTIIDNRKFCLSQYSCFAANKTVRIETYNSGLRGTLFNSNIYIDYGSAVLLNNGAYQGWYSQVRLNGIFFATEYPFTKEYNQYGDDQMNKFKPIIIETAPKLTLEVAPIPGWLDWYLVINVAQADTILMTDYTVVNRHTFIQTPVLIDGSIKPNDKLFMNPLAMVQIGFVYGQNNLRRRND